MVADQELGGDLALVVKANHSPHGDIVLPVHTSRINTTNIPHLSQDSTR